MIFLSDNYNISVKLFLICKKSKLIWNLQNYSFIMQIGVMLIGKIVGEVLMLLIWSFVYVSAFRIAIIKFRLLFQIRQEKPYYIADPEVDSLVSLYCLMCKMSFAYKYALKLFMWFLWTKYGRNSFMFVFSVSENNHVYKNIKVMQNLVDFNSL